MRIHNLREGFDAFLVEKFRDVDGWAFLHNPTAGEAVGFMGKQELRGLVNGDEYWCWMSRDGTHSQGLDKLTETGWITQEDIENDRIQLFVVSTLGPEEYPRVDEYWRVNLKPYGRVWAAYTGEPDGSFRYFLRGLAKS